MEAFIQKLKGDSVEALRSQNNQIFFVHTFIPYGKYPKNSNTKASDKMTYANSVDPDQTAPEGAV